MMDWKNQYRPLLWITAFFALAYFMPVRDGMFMQGVQQALELAHWYAREHVILCLIPAFFIAGTIAVFVSQAAVVKYFGPDSNKGVAYLVASVSGTILAVCSCTVLPLFAGIRRRGAGLGPATAFLYSGPAINVLAIILTARVLGMRLGIARLVGAVLFAVVIGVAMATIFRRSEETVSEGGPVALPTDEGRPLWMTATLFGTLVAILVFATWGTPEGSSGLWGTIYDLKWWITSALGILLAGELVAILGLRTGRVLIAVAAVVLVAVLVPGHPIAPFVAAILALSILLSTAPGEPSEWMDATWGFTRQILPLLGAGVLVAGFLLGSPSGGGVVPSSWVARLVGGNSLAANAFASVAGAFMYFATLTEIPILQGLLAGGMGQGPALALLLAGPALSLPNMLVIRSVIGTRKTFTYVALVVIMSTVSGLIYGALQ